MLRVRIAALTFSVLVLACQSVSLSRPALFPNPTAVATQAPTTSTMGATEALTQIPIHVGHAVRGPWYEVYFTDPADPASAQLSGGLDQALVAAIDAARLSIHLALYSLTLHDVRAALVRAHRRGIDVRAVMESDNMDAQDPQALKDARIPVLGDRREGSMHSKFMIIDGAEVWTGSMNYTVSGVYSDNNNLIRIRSAQIAQDYETEFEEMFAQDRFGPDIGASTPNPRVSVEGVPIEVYFSPDDHVQAALTSLLNAAKSRIDFLAFSFTADGLGDAIVQADAAGVSVSGVMDEDQMRSNLGTEYDAFRTAGLDVRLDGNPGQMHDKVLVVDGVTVVLGSYNFTKSAENTNDENVLVIHSPTIASLYLQEFQRIRAVAGP